jgi:alpha-tubulin suppressor-like RCC1 family protein
MYDHPLLIDPLTATDFAALGIEAAVVDIYVFATNSTTWILTPNGDLYGCGNGYYGQQGSGEQIDAVETFTKRASNVKEVSCTASTTWYIDNNNNLYGCGTNGYGQQGSGESGDTSKVLTFTKRAENVKEVSCSEYTTWYIDNNNDLYGCGDGYYGNQGSGASGDSADVLTFTKRASNVKTVSCTNYVTWYIDNNNDLYGCGYNYCGNQGSGASGDSADVLTFTKRAENVKEVSCTSYVTWYIDNNNDLYGCGNSEYGDQDYGNLDASVLVFTKRASNVKTVSCANYTTWYIDNNNDLYGCGYNYDGNQGSGDTDEVLTFTKRASNVKEVSCTASTTWYIDNNNNLYGCGFNCGNQGSGDQAPVLTFTKRAENVKTVSCTIYTTWYIDNNNDLYGCGDGWNGQQGLGASGNSARVLTFTKREL